MNGSGCPGGGGGRPGGGRPGGGGGGMGGGAPLFAVKAGASGDITLKSDQTSNDGIAWSRVVRWGRDYLGVRHYVFRNAIEGAEGVHVRRALEEGPVRTRHVQPSLSRAGPRPASR